MWKSECRELPRRRAGIGWNTSNPSVLVAPRANDPLCTHDLFRNPKTGSTALYNAVQEDEALHRHVCWSHGLDWHAQPKESERRPVLVSLRHPLHRFVSLLTYHLARGASTLDVNLLVARWRADYKGYTKIIAAAGTQHEFSLRRNASHFGDVYLCDEPDRPTAHEQLRAAFGDETIAPLPCENVQHVGGGGSAGTALLVARLSEEHRTFLAHHLAADVQAWRRHCDAPGAVHGGSAWLALASPRRNASQSTPPDNKKKLGTPRSPGLQQRQLQEEPRPRIGVCLTGIAKTVVMPAHRDHLRAALLWPLQRAASALSVYVHLSVLLPLPSGRTAAPSTRNQECALDSSTGAPDACLARRAAERLVAGSVVTGQMRVVISHDPARNRSTGLPFHAAWPDPCRAADGCWCSGYEQAVKLRGCLGFLHEREEATRRRFDLVLRSRLDVEFARPLPWPLPGATARQLAAGSVHLQAWTLCANPLPGHGGMTDRGLPLRRIGFVDDNLVMVPRALADAYLGLASAYDACLPPGPEATTWPAHLSPNSPDACAGRWKWNECRVEVALRTRTMEDDRTHNQTWRVSPIFGTRNATYWGGMCDSGVRIIDCGRTCLDARRRDRSRTDRPVPRGALFPTTFL